MSTKRLAKEREAAARPRPEVARDTWEQLHALLDQELKTLPDMYRVVIVLCDLEGKSIKETAQQLGCPLGTAGTRLARGRSLLARRLARHGLTLSSGVIAVMIAQNAAVAGVPSLLMNSTIQAATLMATGQAACPGVISAKVATLADGVLKTMLLTKLKIAIAVLLVVALIGVGAGVGAPAARQPGKPPADGQKTPPGKDADKPKTDNDLVQGTWEFASWTQGGKTVKREDFGEKDGRPGTLKFVGDKSVSTDFNTGGKEVEHKGGFKLDQSRKPKEIDLTPEERANKGRTVLGIYELEGASLRLCLPGQPDQERPTRLESKEGETYQLLTYKRVVARDVPEEADRQKADLNMTKTLTLACQIYKIDTGDYPPDLQTLAKPKPNDGRAYIEPAALIPKSAEAFKYALEGPKNNGKRPDIWVDSSNGKIGNWMKEVPKE